MTAISEAIHGQQRLYHPMNRSLGNRSNAGGLLLLQKKTRRIRRYIDIHINPDDNPSSLTKNFSFLPSKTWHSHLKRFDYLFVAGNDYLVMSVTHLVSFK